MLSLTGLSHGVVRVDKEGSLTALTLQDCGMVIPGGIFIYFVLLELCHQVRVVRFPARPLSTSTLLSHIHNLCETNI